MKIRTLKDIYNGLTPDNVESFIEGFSEHLRFYVDKVSEIRQKLDLYDSSNCGCLNVESIEFSEEEKAVRINF